MVAAHGLEPRTHRVWTDCSSQLSYAAMYGASDRDWTGDLILTKDTLCRLSYTSTMNDHFTVNFCGCGDRTWTCDLRVMSPTSYQLLHPAMLYLNLIWRRKRDSNPRDAFTPCRFSRPIPSAGLGYSSILSIFFLVAEEGLEPPTSRVWTVRSSQLSYSAFCCYFFIGGD